MAFDFALARARMKKSRDTLTGPVRLMSLCDRAAFLGVLRDMVMS